jgi:methyl-accepting chemotaxis protein
LALQAICKQLEAGQGALYRIIEEGGKRTVELKLGYALSIGESTIIKYEVGEGLIGQSAASGIHYMLMMFRTATSRLFQV